MKIAKRKFRWKAQDRDLATEHKKIAVLNGSPHKERGNTGLMIEWLLEPARKRGWEINNYNVFEYTIEMCGGCGRCIYSKECAHSDDHTWLMKRLAEADGIILGSPSHFMSVTAQLKIFIDRCLPYAGTTYFNGTRAVILSPAAGENNQKTADYLGEFLENIGAEVVSKAVAQATWPGVFADRKAAKRFMENLGEHFCQQICSCSCNEMQVNCPWINNLKSRRK